MIQVKWPTDVSSVGLSPFSISGMSPPRRVAIVTGAASGIGKAIALKLASDGLNVALNDLPDSLDKLSDVAALASQYGIDTILVPGDVSFEAEVEKMVHDTVNRFGGLDVMIANAGIADRQGSSITEMTTDNWDRMLAIHVRGTFLCYKYAVRQMIQQGRGGRLVGASSVLGQQAMPHFAHYCAAKFAIRGLTQSVALEVGKHGITANAYAPGVINTPMIDGLTERTRAALYEITKKTAIGHEGQPEDVANVVSFLVSEKSGFITGQSIPVNGGWYMN
ncbi:hypothetical protein AX14_001831 [Amanita brunnescens Koide BX004]|nr:hypothetical protein AX14_001831 [Amanita brunnescens Koide BX004]